MFDVFYSGTKPNVFVHEREAQDIDTARTLSRTRYFWWITYLADYTGWNFLWEPQPWESDYVHTWPSQWHEYSGTYLVPKNASVMQYKFHKDIIPNCARPENYKKIISAVDFDWTWHPHPLDQPYVYVFGNQWWPAEQMPTVEYHMPGATDRKFMDQPAILLADKTNWQIPPNIDAYSIDYSWRPDPGDPAYIYEFATQWQPNGGARYVVPGATAVKYVDIQHRRLPDTQGWHELEAIQGFDYSWHPDATEQPYNYVFGNQHWPGTEMPTVVYEMPGADQQKFVDSPVAHLAKSMKNWKLYEAIDQDKWDWTWRPNPQDPPYIYVWGNQWNPPEFKASVQYTVPGATEVK
jgi:hypothetical protein